MEMLTHPMLDQLAKLGLSGMTQAFAELEASGEGATLTHADWLGLLVDREITHRRDKPLAARLRYARLRHHAVVEDVDYRAPRGLDRALFHKLADGEWINAHDNLILCGPTGVGKSWLACALGHKACRDNRSVLYQRVPKIPIVQDKELDAGETTQNAGIAFTRSSRNAMGAVRPFSPVRSPSTNGTPLSATPHTPTLSSTASFTTPIASTSPARASDADAQDRSQGIDHQPATLPKIYCQQGARQSGDIISYRRATSSRNQRATSSESAIWMHYA